MGGRKPSGLALVMHFYCIFLYLSSLFLCCFPKRLPVFDSWFLFYYLSLFIDTPFFSHLSYFSFFFHLPKINFSYYTLI
jgi:hypothetical protein